MGLQMRCGEEKANGVIERGFWVGEEGVAESWSKEREECDGASREGGAWSIETAMGMLLAFL